FREQQNSLVRFQVFEFISNLFLLLDPGAEGKLGPVNHERAHFFDEWLSFCSGKNAPCSGRRWEAKIELRQERRFARRRRPPERHGSHRAAPRRALSLSSQS